MKSRSIAAVAAADVAAACGTAAGWIAVELSEGGNTEASEPAATVTEVRPCCVAVEAATVPTPAIVGLAPGAAELSVDAIGSVAGKPDPDSPNVPTVAFVTELPWGNPWAVGKKAADVAWLVCAGDAGIYPGGGAAIASGSSRSTGSSGRDSSPGALAGAPALAWTLAAKEPLRLLTGAPEGTDVPWVMEALEWLEAAHEFTAPEGDEL